MGELLGRVSSVLPLPMLHARHAKFIFIFLVKGGLKSWLSGRVLAQYVQVAGFDPQQHQK